jgi:hypothetical protein
LSDNEDLKNFRKKMYKIKELLEDAKNILNALDIVIEAENALLQSEFQLTSTNKMKSDHCVGINNIFKYIIINVEIRYIHKIFKIILFYNCNE